MKASGPPMGIEWGSHALRGVAAREAGFISKCCDQALRQDFSGFRRPAAKSGLSRKRASTRYFFPGRMSGPPA